MVLLYKINLIKRILRNLACLHTVVILKLNCMVLIFILIFKILKYTYQ